MCVCEREGGVRERDSECVCEGERERGNENERRTKKTRRSGY